MLNIRAFLFVALCIFSTKSYAQIVLNIETTYENTSQKLYAYVLVDNFKNIVGTQFSINWNQQSLVLNHFNLHPTIEEMEVSPHNAHLTSNTLGFSWNTQEGDKVNLANGSKLIELVFDVKNLIEHEVLFSNTPVNIEFIEQVGLEYKPVPYTLVNNGVSTDQTKSISGKVFWDTNYNCILDEGEIGLPHWAINFDENLTVFSNDLGAYHITTTSGYHQLNVLANELWSLCDNDFSVTVDSLNTDILLNIPAQINTTCPLMKVNIGTGLLRPCFSNTYYIDYCNHGTNIAENSYIEIVLDEFMSFDGSSIPLTSQTGQILRFDLGMVAIGACDQFTINTYLDCESTVLGQTHCTEAYIFPKTNCQTISDEWSGASVQVDGACTGDSILLNIRNIGTGDMMQEASYIIIEDDLIMQLSTPFQLPAATGQSIMLPAEGTTIRLEAAQVANHPGKSMPSISIEACGTNDAGTFSTGFVTQFSQDDADHFVSIDCQESIEIYDAIGKLAFPKGYSDNNYIEPNTDLEYVIRFQNTSNDPAYNIVVHDTLSKWLDPTSVQLGAHSHPLKMTIDNNILTFTFDDIMLATSDTNEAASHAFIYFRVKQLKDNPVGTNIYSKSTISFNFDPPIITNETVHRIGEAFISIGEGWRASPTLDLSTTNLSIYPNPFSDRTTFKLEDDRLEKVQLRLYNHTGSLIRTEDYNGTQFYFYRKNLKAGLYFFELWSDNRALQSGKLSISY